MELRECLQKLDELASRGRYFEAHEELEKHWLVASGKKKILLQGLIQIAAGLHRLRAQPTQTKGAFYLLERGEQKLAFARDLLNPEKLADLTRNLIHIRSVGKAPEGFVLGLKIIPDGLF